ncbi:MAG: hypothetical protein Kow00107_04620 [Planctomycetota bacterium]
MKPAKLLLLTLIVAGAFLLLPPDRAAARIKLATLPVRERVEIQLDNGSFTLVEEERIVPLLKSSPQTGNNFVDFSWTNTGINKDTILFRPIAVRSGDKFEPIGKVKGANGGEVEEVGVINVSFPPGENALVWEVFAAKACAVKVRVSYLVSNLGRSFSYRALADKDETKLSLKKYMLISNYSGEDFGESGIWAGFGNPLTKLVDNRNEIKVLMHTFENVPITKTYTFDWYRHGALSAEKPFASKVLMHYKLKNDTANGMGLFPLQPGKVRIFIDDGHEGEAFLGEDLAYLTPIDDEVKLYLGEASDIVCTRTVKSNERFVERGNLYNVEVVLKYEIENFKNKPCTFTIVEQIDRLAQEFFGDPHGVVQWESGANTSPEVRISNEKGANNPELSIDLPAAPAGAEKVEKKTVLFHVVMKNLW